MPYYLALFERIDGVEDWFDTTPELKAHVRDLVSSGHLLFGGKMEEGPYEGLGLLEADDLETAQSMVNKNPTVGRTTKAIVVEITQHTGTALAIPSQ